MRHLLSWEVDVNRELWCYEDEKDQTLTWEPTSALHLAVEDDNLPMADLLLEHGADANAIFPERMPTSVVWLTQRTLTPLDVAVGRGNESMTLLHLQNGAKIRDEITLRRAIDHGGLLAAVKAGHHKPRDYDFIKLSEVAPNYNFRAVVEVLHLYGANLNEDSLLHDAVEHYGSLDNGVIERLLTLGADVNAKESEGDSVLSRAFENEYYDFRRCKAFVQLLTAHGAKAKPGELANALENAMLSEEFDWFELILDHVADVNSLLYTEGNSLHLVIANEFDHHASQEKFLKSLLNRGADVLLRYHESKTPLEHAISFSWNQNLAKLLLDAGAKAQCQGKEGARLLTNLIADGVNAWSNPDTNDLRDYLDGFPALDLHEFSGIDATIQLLIGCLSRLRR
ncbi:hypothetical protein PEX1_060460 [Penicillium expansum]|nr:hypothetical protein PEX1_060460 [Penicillium expansum]